MKTLLTGMIFCTLFLLSCSGDNRETGLRDEVCSQFIKYKRCTKQLTEDNFLECEQEYDSQMRELRAKYGNAAIPTKEGFNYQDVKNSLDNCVSGMKPEDPLDQWKQCLLDFQNSVLEGFQCNRTRR